MRNFFYLVFSLFLMISCACKKTVTSASQNSATNESVADAKNGDLSGIWVNKEYLDEIQFKKSHIRSRFLPELFELKFKDSLVYTGNGVTEFTSKYTFENDTLTLLEYGNQNDFNASFIKYWFAKDSLGNEKLITKVNKKTSSFVRASKDMTFKTLLNEYMLGGQYAIQGNSNAIEFTKNAEIKGWDLFQSFEICFAGDCIMNSEGNFDIVYLKGPKYSGYYGLKFENGTQTMVILDIKNYLGKGVNAIVAQLTRK